MLNIQNGHEMFNPQPSQNLENVLALLSTKLQKLELILERQWIWQGIFSSNVNFLVSISINHVWLMLLLICAKYNMNYNETNLLIWR